LVVAQPRAGAEPELHLGPRPDKLAPDLAGWKRETYEEDAKVRAEPFDAMELDPAAIWAR
jgi:hypothetical protein